MSTVYAAQKGRQIGPKTYPHFHLGVNFRPYSSIRFFFSRELYNNINYLFSMLPFTQTDKWFIFLTRSTHISTGKIKKQKLNNGRYEKNSLKMG